MFLVGYVYAKILFNMFVHEIISLIKRGNYLPLEICHNSHYGNFIKGLLTSTS